jgi:hypothetical protein
VTTMPIQAIQHAPPKPTKAWTPHTTTCCGRCRTTSGWAFVTAGCNNPRAVHSNSTVLQGVVGSHHPVNLYQYQFMLLELNERYWLDVEFLNVLHASRHAACQCMQYIHMRHQLCTCQSLRRTQSRNIIRHLSTPLPPTTHTFARTTQNTMV